MTRLPLGACGLLFFLVNGVSLPLWAAPPRDVQLTIEADHKTAEFDPRSALGAGLDGHWQGNEMRMLSPASVRQMLSAGLGPISVRLRTELAVEAWHWNPRGRWSDPQHQQGYWISDAQPQPGAPILLSYGYKLPRRGNTLDEANDNGYSRLDDSDLSTFWKSNPYLTRPFTGEPDSAHPQWVVIDFTKPVPIDAIQIHWAEPYATRFNVEYSNGWQVYFGGHPSGVWTTFPHGEFTEAKGGGQLLKLSDKPVKAQFIRIWMTESSRTAPAGSTDQRDPLGYAIREVRAGACGASGVLRDRVTHVPNKRQTLIHVSSTDPWHRASDRDPKVEQPGMDLIFRSGITRGLPIMLAIPVLYDNPENAAALAAYVRRSGYPVGRHELGEEPDGQRVDPHDFGALYAETAKAIRKVVPQAVLGGPSFVTANVDYLGINYHQWIGEFRAELERRGQSGDLRFLSFESYPFDDVRGAESKQLPQAAWILGDSMARLQTEHLPLVIGEFNYSAYPTQHGVDLGGAMLNAETAAQFLSNGGTTAYYYGYEPDKLEQKSGSWGSQMMLLRKKDTAIPVATFHAMRLLTSDWMAPQGGPHQAFRVRTNLPQKKNNLLSAFALKRPDQSWSLLVINKDPKHAVRFSLGNFKGFEATSSGNILITYSAKEYSWQAAGPNGHPSLNNPPSRRPIRIEEPITVPPWSISVVRAN